MARQYHTLTLQELNFSVHGLVRFIGGVCNLNASLFSEFIKYRLRNVLKVKTVSTSACSGGHTGPNKQDGKRTEQFFIVPLKLRLGTKFRL